jgi:translation initiation factor 1
LPKDLCVCDDLSADEQEIIISLDTRKWGKKVTMMNFKGNFDANLNDILRKAKRKIGSGGTIRDNSIEIRGDHRLKMKKFLKELGYDSDRIYIKEVR